MELADILAGMDVGECMTMADSFVKQTKSARNQAIRMMAMAKGHEEARKACLLAASEKGNESAKAILETLAKGKYEKTD